ncbi:MAG: hypothetical protein WBC86_22730, partial [Pseudolabrys sp.]
LDVIDSVQRERIERRLCRRRINRCHRSGVDTLDLSGTTAGGDRGIGNDTYVVDSLGDAVIEAVSEGTDTVDVTGSNATSAQIGSDGLSGIENVIGRLLQRL